MLRCHLFKEASATESSVSRVRAQLAGAEDLKEETEECVTVLYLSFGYIRRAGSVGRVGGIQILHPPSPFRAHAQDGGS